MMYDADSNREAQAHETLMPHGTKILRFPAVIAKTGLSRSTLYGRIRSGDFPRPVVLGAGRAVGFPEPKVDRWIASLHSRVEAAS